MTDSKIQIHAGSSFSESELVESLLAIAQREQEEHRITELNIGDYGTVVVSVVGETPQTGEIAVLFITPAPTEELTPMTMELLAQIKERSLRRDPSPKAYFLLDPSTLACRIQWGPALYDQDAPPFDPSAQNPYNPSDSIY